MLKRKESQKGAVMLETAYVLPVLLGVVLFIVETLSFALNSLLVNDVLTDIHLTIVDEVQEISSLESGESPSSSVLYAYCDGGSVRLPVGENESMTALAVSALEAKGVAMLDSNPAKVTVSMQTESGFDLYLIRFTGTADLLVLPNFLNELLPMDVDTVVSIKASCVSS
ncbi:MULTISPECIES: hypothetical protein [Thiomicrorhabdus]|uniref:TadE-like protein n=1 Tax=Thiomicrorhabdus xiamenensis TaxID=2739063 RepID=A0A7D4SIG6_9GAMM|nr:MULTISPECIES: hypothetical protein [Thiomicrorhabdus]MBO1923800.1 hypothetical protein [Thiomicrorhabdus sp. 6S3-12]QKI88599.1 hypothetical protein HQN79_02925 [Thiomicrorhabdus xiamenensis]